MKKLPLSCQGMPINLNPQLPRETICPPLPIDADQMGLGHIFALSWNNGFIAGREYERAKQENTVNRAPIFIELALWYYTTPLEHPSVGLHGAPAYNETVRELVQLGLLVYQQSAESCYRPTDGLTVYVEALGNVPIPELRWVMPEENT